MGLFWGGGREHLSYSLASVALSIECKCLGVGFCEMTEMQCPGWHLERMSGEELHAAGLVTLQRSDRKREHSPSAGASGGPSAGAQRKREDGEPQPKVGLQV